MNTYRATKDGSPRLLSRSKPPPPPTAGNVLPLLSTAGEEPAVPSKNLPSVDDNNHRYQHSHPPPLQAQQQQLDHRYDPHLLQQQQQHQQLPSLRHGAGVTPSRSTSSYLSSFSLPSSDSVGFDDFLGEHGQHATFRQGYDSGLSFSQDEATYSSSWSSYPSFTSPQEYSHLSSSVQRSTSLASTSHRFQNSFSSSHSLSLGTSSSSATLASVASTAASSLMEPHHQADNPQKGGRKQHGPGEGEHEEDPMTESDDDAKEHEQVKDESGPRPQQTLQHSSDHTVQNRPQQQQQPLPLQPPTYSHPQSSQHQPPAPQQETYSASFMTEREFLQLIDDYLLSLSPKKREKALLSNAMYQKILMVLLQPKNTQVSTAQFRFWAKKMFTLSTTPTHHIVCHGGKPVATKECLYDVLVYCHRKSAHGGRDKTSAEVRQHYSWVPKELIARFVKSCPLCSSRRLSLARVPSSVSTSGTPMISSSTHGGERELSDVRKDEMMEADEGLPIQPHYSQQTKLQQSAPWGPLPSVAIAPLSSLDLETQISRERPLASSESPWPSKSHDVSVIGSQDQQALKGIKVERDNAPISGMTDQRDEQRYSLEPSGSQSSPLEGPWLSSQGAMSAPSGGKLPQRGRDQFLEQDMGEAGLDGTRHEANDQGSDGGDEADAEGVPCDDYPDLDEGDYPSKEKPQEVIERIAGAYFGHHHDTHDPGTSAMRHPFLHLPRYHADLHTHQQNPGLLHHQGSSARTHPSAHNQPPGEMILHGRQLVANRHLQVLGYPAASTATSENPSHSSHAPAVIGHSFSRLTSRGLHSPSMPAGHTNAASSMRHPYPSHQGRPPHPQQAQGQGDEYTLSRASLQGYEARSSYGQRNVPSSQAAFPGSMSEYGGDASTFPASHIHPQTPSLHPQQQHPHLTLTQGHQHPFHSHHPLPLGTQHSASRHTLTPHPADQLWSQGRYFQYHHHRSSSDSVTQQLHASPPLSRLFPSDGAYESYSRYRSSATFSEDMDERTSLSGNDSLMFSSSSTNLFAQDDTSSTSRSTETVNVSQGKTLRRAASASQQLLLASEEHKGGSGSIGSGEARNYQAVPTNEEDNSMAIDVDDNQNNDRNEQATATTITSTPRMDSQQLPSFGSQSTAPSLPPPTMPQQFAPTARHSFPGYYQHPSLYHLSHPFSLQSTSQLFQQVPSYIYPAADHSREGMIQRPPSQPSLSSSSQQHFTDLPPLQRSASQGLTFGSYDGSSSSRAHRAPQGSLAASRSPESGRHDRDQETGARRDQVDQDQIMSDDSDHGQAPCSQPITGGAGESQGSSSGRRLSVSANVDSSSSASGATETGESSGQGGDTGGRALCKSSSLAHLLH